MSHIPFTLLAYFLNATAVTVDKFMLTKHIPNPLIYIFYFSAFSALALLALPFTKIPSLEVFLIASTSTVLWTTGAYFMFKALQVGLVSRVIPIIGTLIPMILLLEAVWNKTISTAEITAIILLIGGIIFLTIMDWKGKISRQEIIFELLSATLFAISYLVLRQAYLRADFLTVLVWSRFIILPVSIIVLLVPKLKIQVFSNSPDQPQFSLFSKAGLLFLFGQAAGGSSELLLTFSISLATPALVNSLQGTQYAFLFLFSLVLAQKFPEIFKENFSSLMIISKLVGIGFIASGLFMLAQ
jgi:uncharacterized membrane protein